MPLISTIGRKAPGVRLLIAAIYLVLIVGGASMVYPLLLMISGSVKGGFDAHDIGLVPGWLRSETAFFQRFIESRYNRSLALLNGTWGTDFLDWMEVAPPAPISERLWADYVEFRRGEFPARWVILGHAGLAAPNQRGFKLEVLRESGGDMERAGRLLGTKFRSWSEVVPRQRYLARFMERDDLHAARTDEFKLRRPPSGQILVDLEAHWRTLLFKKYGANVANYRKQTGVPVRSWADLHLPATAPGPDRTSKRAVWEKYVRQDVPLAFLRFGVEGDSAWRAFLHRAYKGDLAHLNRSHGTNHGSFEEMSLRGFDAYTGVRFMDFIRFLRSEAPVAALGLDGPTFRWRAFLERRFHGDLAAARRAYGVTWRSFEEVGLPGAAADWRDFQAEKSTLRWSFMARNYGYVLDFLARHGRGFQNTFILCVLFVVTHLTVNPLAAYALSRFRLPSTYKILLFCMATVAFPGEVMMIPSFLQLKEFGLLNTYAALVLPTLASGYSIFLLKGFFDSLPKELYESAAIDGAGEWTVFWNITMSLSKPILAVMALQSFTSAFGAFFFALIICPDQKMWTLMVWLYQLQMTSGSQSINYAALCLASIPTLLVFVFCQGIILRGIVIPSEK